MLVFSEKIKIKIVFYTFSSSNILLASLRYYYHTLFVNYKIKIRFNTAKIIFRRYFVGYYVNTNIRIGATTCYTLARQIVWAFVLRGHFPVAEL